MKKINNFDEIQASDGSYQRLPVGGYIVGVKDVEDVPEKEYLRIKFDICKGEYKNWFQKEFDGNTKEDKKWPNSGTLIRSYKEKALPMFKGFTTAVEKSNNGFTWNWDEKKLKNKVFGVVIGEEEYLNQKGQVRVRNYVAAVRSVDVIDKGDFTVPELKKLDASKTAANSNEKTVENPFADDDEDKVATSATAASPFDDDDGECPFD